MANVSMPVQGVNSGLARQISANKWAETHELPPATLWDLRQDGLPLDAGGTNLFDEPAGPVEPRRAVTTEELIRELIRSRVGQQPN